MHCRTRDPSGGASAPTSISDYEAILDSLDESIALRAEIDSTLGDVELIIDSLSQRSTDARATAASSRAELAAIARVLSAAVGSSRSAFDDLDALEGVLGTSADLARLIADELKELDRRLGPTVP